MAWLVAFTLTAGVVAFVATLLTTTRRDDDHSRRPRGYRPRHRAAWLVMDRAQVLADDRVIAEMEAALAEETR